MQKKIAFWRSVQFTYIVVLLIALGFFVAMTVIVSRDRDRLNEIIYADRKAERQEVFDKMIRLNSQSLVNITRENTYWDEMVSFIEEPDTQESKTFIEEVLKPQIDMYGADAVWTYNASFDLTSNVNIFSPEFSNMDLNFDQQELTDMFKGKSETTFYLQTDVGLIEVIGSTVHPSSDINRLTSPRGYFFFGRLLKGEYLDTISKDSGSTVSVLSGDELYSRPTEFDHTEGKVAFYKDLTDQNKQTVGQFYVEYSASTIGEVVKSFNRIIINIISGYIILAVAVYTIVARWMLRPLYNVYMALATNSIKPLNKLVNSKSEFGRIANLIVAYFKQRDEINSAVKDAIVAKEKLENRTQELEHTNNLMIKRELRMIELKKEIAELKARLGEADKHE